jgi:O-antigen ligase
MQILALVMLGFTIAALILHRGRRLVLMAGLTGLVFTTALILTGSRASIVSFLATMFVVLISVIGRKGALAAAALVVLLAPVAMMVLVAERAPQTGTLADDSASRRLAYMRAGMRVIPHHPLLG